jgi:hypothetical protein
LLAKRLILLVAIILLALKVLKEKSAVLKTVKLPFAVILLAVMLLAIKKVLAKTFTIVLAVSVILLAIKLLANVMLLATRLPNRKFVGPVRIVLPVTKKLPFAVILFAVILFEVITLLAKKLALLPTVILFADKVLKAKLAVWPIFTLPFAVILFASIVCNEVITLALRIFTTVEEGGVLTHAVFTAL